MKVLVVAAHPDDEVLGCGGTIAKMVKDGHSVHTIILGEGVAARGIEGANNSTKLQELQASARSAAKILGAKGFELFQFPDNRFDSVPLLDIVKKIEGVIEEHSPEIVFTQHGGDLNVDHALTFRAVLAATRPMRGISVKSVLTFEVNSSTEWAFQRFSPGFRPSVFVDVSSTMPQKMEALAAYSSEMRAFPHPRSKEAIEAQAIKWGSVAGLLAAEAFEVIWEIR